MRNGLFHKSKYKDSLLTRRDEREELVFKLKVFRCIRETGKLALPVVVSRLGVVGMDWFCL